MPTPFESAQLLLTLYDQRREETMRQARGFYTGWDPRSFEDVMATMTGPKSGMARMVMTYWDMAAAFVDTQVVRSVFVAHPAKRLLGNRRFENGR